MPDNTKSLKIITIILAILFIGSTSLLILEIGKVQQQDKTIRALNSTAEEQKQRVSELENNTTALQRNLTRTEEQLRNETRTRQMLEREITNLTTVAKSDYGVLAVDENGKGFLIPLEIILKSGGGNIFINVANVVYDQMLQSSAQTAVKVASEVTGVSLADKDVLINIEAPAEARGLVIAGGSGGAAMTLATMAALQNKTVRKDVLITGTIEEDHSIGRIGAPRAKAIAAKENGAVLFLVPVGQKSEVGNDVGIEVKEVASIEDAAGYAIR